MKQTSAQRRVVEVDTHPQETPKTKSKVELAKEAKKKHSENCKYRIAYMDYFYTEFGLCSWCNTFVMPYMRANLWFQVVSNIGSAIGYYLTMRFLKHKIDALFT